MRAARFHDGHSGATHTVQPFVFGRELRLVDQHDTTVAVWKLDDIQAAPELDPEDQHNLVEGRPGVVEPIFGKGNRALNAARMGWTFVSHDLCDEDEMANLLRLAWSGVAPKRLTAPR